EPFADLHPSHAIHPHRDLVADVVVDEVRPTRRAERYSEVCTLREQLLPPLRSDLSRLDDRLVKGDQPLACGFDFDHAPRVEAPPDGSTFFMNDRMNFSVLRR